MPGSSFSVFSNRRGDRQGRVARWYIFKPNPPIWVNFGGSYNGRFKHIRWPFGKFWRVLQWKILHILWPFGIFFGYFVYFSRFGMLYHEKSGNPAEEKARRKRR
jgi:hypothetical protein